MREPTNGDRYEWLRTVDMARDEDWVEGPWVIVLRGYVAMAVHEEKGTLVPWHAVARLSTPLPEAVPVVTPDPGREAGE